MVTGVCAKLPKKVAPGPSGWTYELFRASVGYEGDSNSNLWAQVFTAWANAKELPAPLLASRLIPLSKKGGGIRPIAISEALLRIVQRFGSYDLANALKDNAHPGQVGVGIKGASETAVLVIREWVKSGFTVSIDFLNAFNKAERAAFISHVAEWAPVWLPFINSVYGSPTPLIVNETHVIESQTGTRQGDPMAPALFAMALDPALKAAEHAARTACGYDESGLGIIAYLDDVTLHADQLNTLTSSLIEEVVLDLVLEQLSLQDSILIARSCLHSRFNYLLRACGPMAADLASRADQIFEEYLARCLSLGSLNPKQLLQLHLPTRFGGLGFTSLSSTFHAAYLGNVGLAIQSPSPVISDSVRQLLDTDGHLAQTTNICRSHLGTEEGMWPSQNSSCEVLHEAASCNLMELHSLPLVEAARLNSTCCPIAAAWLLALPITPGLTFTDAEFTSSMQDYIGVPSHPGTNVTCGCGNIDEKYHALCCNALAGAWTPRHDKLKYVALRCVKAAGIKPEKEVALAPLSVLGPNSIGTPDVIFVAGGSEVMADLTVIHPAATSYVDGAARTPGHAAAGRERLKNRKYGPLIALRESNGGNVKFFPLVFETFGRTGKSVDDFLIFLNSVKTRRWTPFWWRLHFACALRKGNAEVKSSVPYAFIGHGEAAIDGPSL